MTSHRLQFLHPNLPINKKTCADVNWILSPPKVRHSFCIVLFTTESVHHPDCDITGLPRAGKNSGPVALEGSPICVLLRMRCLAYVMILPWSMCLTNPRGWMPPVCPLWAGQRSFPRLCLFLSQSICEAVEESFSQNALQLLYPPPYLPALPCSALYLRGVLSSLSSFLLRG